ncbi:peptidase M61 [Asticcacaulis sp. EMRT-3]|uniref:M61 family metallopeptidase n=1 Tax=Asticcacaulis sp. EMRT-3 TaxID=3040349 RepID=UPI0032C21336
MPPAIAAAQDVAFNGTIRLDVDMTDLQHRLIKVHEVVPATPGPLTLLVPKWLPGDHEPDGDGELTRMAGFTFSAGGAPLVWTRDPVAVNAFHIDVPQGASQVTVDFTYLAPVDDDIGRVVMTPDMANLEWNFASVYPAGYYVSRIPVQATLRLPEGWQQGSALEPQSVSADNMISFKPVSYATLVDSPVLAGRYFKRFDLDPGANTPVHMDVVADKPSSLDVPDSVLAIHRDLVQQAYKLFGAHHYDHYDFLVAATDKLGDIGLEHHRSSENSVEPDYFTNWSQKFYGRDLLAHEFTHSWNGKYRRPWDLWIPDFQAPMRDSLLWVYEGQTEYWGNVLAARSGLYSRDQYLGHLAMIAGYYDTLASRQWRDLQDTTNDPIIAERAAQSWPNWQGSEDYYDQGLLIWLDADTLIRQKTGGKKSLDDFARVFFGVHNGDWNTLTYNTDDVVAALNSVYPYDWATFLHSRLHDHGQPPPFDGLTRAGYKLVYSDKENDYLKARETFHKWTDFNYSLGFTVDFAGRIRNVLWQSPAYKAGLTKGMRLIAVNGLEFDGIDLKDVIKADAATGNQDQIDLLIKADDRYKTITLNYHGGLRYPNLVRIDGTKDMLADIIAAKK